MITHSISSSLVVYVELYPDKFKSTSLYTNSNSTTAINFSTQQNLMLSLDYNCNHKSSKTQEKSKMKKKRSET